MTGAVAAVETSWCELCGTHHARADVATVASAPARVLPWRERREARPRTGSTPAFAPAPLSGRQTERVGRPRHASFGFPLHETAPRRARRHTVDFARLWRMDDVVETAELLVSELMTNALEASRHGPRRILDGGAAVAAPLELRLRAEHRRLRIEVRDHNPRPPVTGDPTLHDERGRGLLLVDMFSDVWGYRRLATGGKVVWCVVSPGDPPDPS